MRQFKYIKADAFTSGASRGNPAACVFLEEGELTESQMLACAKEHKGFVMEMVFCGKAADADCKLTYYSSECEVDFCGHGTIATMYAYLQENPALRERKVLNVRTNRKGMIQVFNEMNTEDAVYITAPDAIEHTVTFTREAAAAALGLAPDALDASRPVRVIDAGLRTLIVPVKAFSAEVSVYPDMETLRSFLTAHDIDIALIFCMQTDDASCFAHTRVFAPKFGYLEDPATGSGNSAFANYMLQEGMWDGSAITVEQGGDDRVFNAVRLKVQDAKVLFGGRATVKIKGCYYVR